MIKPIDQKIIVIEKMVYYILTDLEIVPVSCHGGHTEKYHGQL